MNNHQEPATKATLLRRTNDQVLAALEALTLQNRQDPDLYEGWEDGEWSKVMNNADTAIAQAKKDRRSQ